MTDYFVGGEDTGIIMTGVLQSNAPNLGQYCRAGFARIGYAAAASSTTVPPTAYFTTPVLANMTSFWVHCQYGTELTSTANTANMPCIWLYDSAGVIRLLIRATGTNGQYKITTRNAAGTLTDLVTSAAGIIPTGQLGTRPIAIDWFVNYSATGQSTLYINGVNVLDTGPNVNITTNSATSLAQAGFQTMTLTANFNNCFSELLIRDTTTLGAAVYTIPPVASGNTQSWTPNTVGNINESVINDGLNVATTAANALSEWTVSTTLPTGGWVISSVQQEARVSVGATGPQHFEWLVRTVDGTDHVTGTVAPTTSLANYRNNWPTNPHTTVAWAAGDLINTGIESLA